MNKILKTAFVAAGVVGTVGAVSTAEAANFNVVVDKIEVFTDGDNISTGVTVYDPANNIGATSTQTIDLFDATQKQGTTLSLAIPPVNTYESVLVHISSMEISGTSVGVGGADISATFAAANATQTEFAPNGSTLVLALGNIGAGSGSIANSYAGISAGIPIQPTTISGAGFSFPALNLELDEATAVDTGASSVSELLTTFPVVTTVNANATDNASVANLQVPVDTGAVIGSAASATIGGFVSGTSVLSVGLFDSSLPARPYAVETFTPATDASGSTVTFTDAPSATVVPIAWYDADSDGKLDAGEYFAGGQTFPGAITGFDYDLTTLAAASGVVSDAAVITVDNALIAMGPRTQTVTVAMPTADVTATQDGNGFDGLAGITGAIFTTSAGGDDTIDVSAATGATLTVVYQVTTGVSRTVELSAAIGDDGAGASGSVEVGEDFFVGLATSTTADSTVGYSWAVSGTAGALSIAVPLAIDTVANGENTGTYAAEFKVGFTDADDAYVLPTQGIVSADGTSNTLIVTATAATGDVTASAAF